MKAALLLCMFAAAPALAAEVEIGIRFDAPPVLVVVEPGIQVVPDFEAEVFFVDGWYWTRKDDAWYHSQDHKGSWVVVELGHVPPGLKKIPPGHYKKWKPEKAAKAKGPKPGKGKKGKK